MSTQLWQRIRFARAQVKPKLTQQAIADAFGISREAVAQWESTDEKQRTVPETEKIERLARLMGCPLAWLLSDRSELSMDGWNNAPIPMFTPERRANDDATALQIGLESLAAALFQKIQGSASAFLVDLAEVCEQKKFSPDHKLLGKLSDIAEQVRGDEAKAVRAKQRADSAHRTKRGT